MSKILVAMVGLLFSALGGWQFGTVVDPTAYQAQGFVFCGVVSIGLMLLAIKG